MTQDSDLSHEYDNRFSKSEIEKFRALGISPQIARQYKGKYTSWQICTFFEEGFMPEVANIDLPQGRWIKYEISEAVEKGRNIKRGNHYNEQFSNLDVLGLIQAGCSPEYTEAYDRSRYSGSEIARLYELGCTPEEANQYHEKIAYVSDLYRMGVRANRVDIETQKRLHSIFSKVGCIFPEHYVLRRYGYPSFIATGRSSVIMLEGEKTRKRSACKFSDNIGYEAGLLKKIKRQNRRLKNVIKIKGKNIIAGIAIQLEYINGITLKDKVEKANNNLSGEEVLWYASHVLNGLVEMRRAGIYHRDLHEMNILISSKSGEAVIIDLGCATENPNEVYERNRSYGGNNDLVSLGLLMYKMATKRNLFNDESAMTIDRKDQVKLEREKAYANPELKHKYLSIVKGNISDQKCADMVIQLLEDDLWTQPDVGRVVATWECIKL